ncbi:MAG: peptide chain release factor N(5)-glutamine methyltransferase [Lachnospiraceae bacterium]|nr:peptide chain release factor N(5)-glutamine methyltransferase [Lachnospiraceae bacterium]
MKVKELVQYGEAVLKEAGIETYKSDVKVLITYVLNVLYSDYFMCLDKEATEEQNKLFQNVINKRKTLYPCQYITNSQEFMGLEFYVSEGVLIPRPETELLVEEAIKQSFDKSMRVLDLCCGSGCIGISYSILRKQKGYDDKVVLGDISPVAIEISTRNNNTYDAACDIVQTDLFSNISGRFNMIISNPPYIETEEIDKLMEDVKCFEPRLALDGLEDGLFFYREIISKAKNYFEDSGCLIFEIGYNQYEAVKALFEREGYHDIKLIKDYAGLDRIVLARYS